MVESRLELVGTRAGTVPGESKGGPGAIGVFVGLTLSAKDRTHGFILGSSPQFGCPLIYILCPKELPTPHPRGVNIAAGF